MEVNNNNPRSWERKQDVDEILSIIGSRFLNPDLKDNSKSLFVWYMIKKGKIKDTSKHNIHPEVKATLDKMDNMVETIKAFDTLDMNNGDKKHTHIMNIVSIIRDDFMNMSLRLNDYPNVFVGFMYGYYFKAGILTVMDVVSLENGSASRVGGPASYGMVVASILKDIDSNSCLDKSKYKFQPVVQEAPKPESKVEEKVPEKKVEKMDYLYSTNNTTKITVKASNKKEPEYKNRYIVIRGGTGRRPNKPDARLDMLEVYNYFKEGFSSVEISELYDVSDYTIRAKVREFCKDNNLKIVLKVGTKPKTSKSKKNVHHKPAKSEDDLMYEKAVLANAQTINKLKNKTYPSIAKVEDSRKFQNFPVTFSSKSKDKKLVIDDKLKSKIDKEGSGYYILNDGLHYYVTSGDYLIFRNEPTAETLEKYRSVKTS